MKLANPARPALRLLNACARRSTPPRVTDVAASATQRRGLLTKSRTARAAHHRPAYPSSLAATRNHSGCGCAAAAARRTTKTAYIALGSNLGDRVAEIEKACNAMDRKGIRVKRTSSLWETEPMYVKDQGQFVNGVCEVETELDPLALLDQLQAIEQDMGRKKVIDKGPRNIDLDILLYGEEVVAHERLNIPHIGITEREFVLRPLAEYAPQGPHA
jgi:2-amino-4-hydroxy-6-hydroxymethyldihydropteridine diphosphokinase/dihydropteroate synthase